MINKKLIISIFFLVLLINSVHARPNTACTNAGFTITNSCNLGNGDLIINLSIREDLDLPNIQLSDSDTNDAKFVPPTTIGYTSTEQNVCCAINEIPEITSVPNTGILFPGDYYEYQVEVSEDLHDLIYYLRTSVVGMSMDSETGLLSWDSAFEGTHNIEIEVSDGYYSDYQNFTLEVVNTECNQQGYVCKETPSLGDIEQVFDCGNSNICVDPYAPPSIEFPEFFWQLKIYQNEWYGVNWTTKNYYGTECYQSGTYDINDCPILYPNSQFQDQVTYNQTIEGDMNFWLLGYDGDEQDYGQREYLIMGNHPIKTAYIIDEDTSEIDCVIQDYMENETYYNSSNGELYNVTYRRLYVISYPQHTWGDGEAQCEIAVDDGIKNTTIMMNFTETARSHFSGFTSDDYDPLGYTKQNLGVKYPYRTETYNGIDVNITYSPYWNQTAGLLPYDFTVVHGNWTMGVNVTGRYADKVIWRYVWFNYYSEQGIPPEIPTAGWNRKLENGSWGDCTQERIDANDDVFNHCNYFHFVWMDTTYNFSMDENKIFEGVYNSQLSQWNDDDVMWRYYAHVYDRDVHWSDRHYVRNIIFDNFAPGAPQNFSAHTYPNQYGNYPGRIGVDFAAPGDNGDKGDISFANYDITYNETQNWGYYCYHYDQATEISRKNMSGCGWYEFKYRDADLGPITEENWNDPDTVLYEPSLSWEPTPNGTYDHGLNHDDDPFNCMDFYPQYVPDFCKNEWVDLPETRKDYYVALRAYDGEGNAGALATDFVTSGYEFDMDVGFDDVTGINDTGWYNTFTVLDCNRDRDADKWDDCQTYKDDNGYYPPEPNWIRRTMYLGDELTINTTFCNFGNQDFNDYVYLISYGQGGHREEDKIWVDLPYNESWYDFNLTQQDRDQEDSLAGYDYPKNCMDITFNHVIDRESFYMYYYVEIRRNNSDPNKHPGDQVSWDDLASLNNYYQDWDFDYTFHTFSTDSIAKDVRTENINGSSVNVEYDPYFMMYNQWEPYNNYADYHMIWEIDNAFDTRFPMWEFPVHYEIIGLNGTNANKSLIYNFNENGDGPNYYSKVHYFNQSDSAGFRNNYTEYVNISDPIFYDIRDPRHTDWPYQNTYVWNETLGWYQYEPNETLADYELYFYGWPGVQSRYFHLGSAGNYSVNITIGTGFDSFSLPMKWSIDGYEDSYTNESNNITREFEAKEVQNLYPNASGLGCWVDLNSDKGYLGWNFTYTDSFGQEFEVPAQGSNISETDNDTFLYTTYLNVEYFNLFYEPQVYHFQSNNDMIYTWWNWVQNWTACDEITRPITVDDVIYISYDIVNPNPSEEISAYGISLVDSSKLYSYVNGERVLEDIDWHNNYIQGNNGTLNAHFYFRPKRTGTHTFEAAIDRWNHELDETTMLPITFYVSESGATASAKITEPMTTYTFEEIEAMKNPQDREINVEKKEKGFFRKALDFGKKIIGIEVEEEKGLDYSVLEAKKEENTEVIADWDLIEQYRIDSEKSAKELIKPAPLPEILEYELIVMEAEAVEKSSETKASAALPTAEVIVGGIE